MAFKVKDLMIDVLGVQQQICVTGTANCNVCALLCTHQLTPQCHFHNTACYWYCSRYTPPCTPNCTVVGSLINPCQVSGVCGDSMTPQINLTPTIVELTPVLQQGDITPLKQQLKAALEAVEKQEVVINEQLQPKTLEDLNLLEAKLNDALGHIKQQKVELEKKPK